MNSEAGMTCPGCGKPLKEGAAFCTNCGAAVGAQPGVTDAARPPEAVPAGAPPPPPAPPITEAQLTPPTVPPAAGEVAAGVPVPGMVPPTPPRRGKAGLIVGIIGGVLIVAGIVVLVLWLTMWRDGGGGGTGDPIALAEKYISALEKGDVDAYLACFEEDFLEDNPIVEGMGMDMKELLKMSFEMMEVEFKGYALEIEAERGDSATVVTTEGTVTMAVMGFEQEYDLAEDPMVFEMVKKGGRWYLTQDPMPGSMGGGMDFDLEDMEDFDLEDFNLEDMEQFFPEDMNLEDLQDMSPEELEEMLEEMERLMEDMPQGGAST